jgi:hypothetical protein
MSDGSDGTMTPSGKRTMRGAPMIPLPLCSGDHFPTDPAHTDLITVCLVFKSDMPSEWEHSYWSLRTKRTLGGAKKRIMIL